MTGEAVLASLQVRANLVELPAEGGPVAGRAGDAGNADGRLRAGQGGAPAAHDVQGQGALVAAPQGAGLELQAAGLRGSGAEAHRGRCRGGAAPGYGQHRAVAAVQGMLPGRGGAPAATAGRFNSGGFFFGSSRGGARGSTSGISDM